jgi:hypothetical protein
MGTVAATPNVALHLSGMRGQGSAAATSIVGNRRRALTARK